MKNSLLKTIRIIYSDLKFHSKSKYIGVLLAFYFDPSFRLLMNYRIGHYLLKKHRYIYFLIAKYYSYRQVTKRNCCISYYAILGKHIKFPHPLSIVIGDGVKIGNNVTIWQNVTIGSHGKKNETISYPIINNNVRIFAGSIIIGNVQVGANVDIGANTFINKNVPANSIAYGNPLLINSL